MKSEDIKIFNGLLIQLSEVFDDGREVSESKAIIYFNLLANYTLNKVEFAINSLLKTRVYPGFPKPAEIIKVLDDHSEEFTARENTKNLIEELKVR